MSGMDIMRKSVPDRWLHQLFSAKSVAKGGVVRRSVTWVESEIGRDTFVQEVRLRGYHLFEGGGQFIVVCCSGPIRQLV